MTLYKSLVVVIFAVAVIAAGTTGAGLAAEPQLQVVGDMEIQARIDQQIGQADADRQAIQLLLQRAEVRRIAGSSGLDLERASAAAAVLSGPSLEKLAAQARMVDAAFAGGDGRVVITTTALIIVLLLLILLLR